MSNCEDLATKQDLLNLYQLVNEQALRIDRLENELERIKLEIIAITTGLVAVVAIAAAPLIAAAVAGIAAELAALGASLGGAIAVVEAEIVAVGGVASSALAYSAATEAQLITLGTVLQGEIVAVEGTAAGALALATTAQATAGGALVLATAQGELALIESQILTLSRTPGPPGEAGIRGEKGDRGFDGDDGLDGADGRQGDKGDRGSDGADGVDGRDGADGADGEQGRQGDKGDKGDKGDRGFDGADGRDGAKGDRGEPGSSLQNEPNSCQIDLIYQDSILTANLTVNNSSATDNVKIMEFTVIQVEKITCKDGEATSQMVSVAVLKGTEDAEREAYAARARIGKAQCESECIATVPEGWQLKKEQSTSQLAIIFRPEDKKIRTGNYPLYIPHYNGNPKPKIPAYKKGDYWARWILSDNSQIHVNASSRAESLRVIRILESYVLYKYRTNPIPWLVTGQTTPGTFKEIKVAPIRADFYPTGKANNTPEWRYYFKPQ